MEITNFNNDKRKEPLMGYKNHNSFYASKKWRELRGYKLSHSPFCEFCLKEGKIVEAVEVDHIVPIWTNEALALDLDNLQSLCKSCHSAKTATDKQKRGKGVILNKKYNVT